MQLHQIVDRRSPSLVAPPTLPTRQSGGDAWVYAPLLWGDVGFCSEVWSNWGFGKTKEEEGSRKTPSLAARVGYSLLLRSGFDGYGIFLTIVKISALVFKFYCISWFFNLVLFLYVVYWLMSPPQQCKSISTFVCGRYKVSNLYANSI